MCPSETASIGIPARQTMNLPNKLTVARIIMVPAFVALMSVNNVLTYVLAYITFTIAAITDYYDGKIARERGIVTNFGKLLDPLADKVLLASGFVMMMDVEELRVPGWTIVAILTREFLVTGARTIAASDGVVIAASSSGKFKTVFQMVYVFTFMFFAIAERIAAPFLSQGMYEAVSYWLRTASLVAIVFVAVYTIYSGIDFARANWRTLSLGKDV
jgi:CDP-diacylglycerol--glycerol-3-phosphate 3-phosphatidyltransferase